MIGSQKLVHWISEKLPAMVEDERIKKVSLLPALARSSVCILPMHRCAGNVAFPAQSEKILWRLVPLALAGGPHSSLTWLMSDAAPNVRVGRWLLGVVSRVLVA